MAATEAGTRAAVELDELYRRHAANVYRYAYAVLGNRQDAEDVTQTTFVNALGALERGERPRAPENWLLTIAHNLVRQRFRQAHGRPAEVALTHEVPGRDEPDDATPTVDEVVRALGRIPAPQREAIVLREFEGRSYAEIAGILGVTTAALETLLFRARRSLAEELDNLVTCEHAEQALSRQLDGRLSRRDRRRLAEHVQECPHCARFQALQVRQRRALKGLALVPLPLALTLFKGTNTAAAAALPSIGTAGAGTAVGGTAAGSAAAGGAAGGLALGGGLAVKAAALVAAAGVAGGVAVGVEQARNDPPTKTPPAATTQSGDRPGVRAGQDEGSVPPGQAVADAARSREKPVTPGKARAADKGRAQAAQAKANAAAKTKGRAKPVVERPARGGQAKPAREPGNAKPVAPPGAQAPTAGQKEPASGADPVGKAKQSSQTETPARTNGKAAAASTEDASADETPATSGGRGLASSGKSAE